MIGRLVQNASSLLLAKIVNSTLSLLTFLIVARTFSVTETGQYAFAIAAASIVLSIAGWGGADFLFRRGAINVRRLPPMIRALTTVRLLLAMCLGVPVVTFAVIYQSTEAAALLLLAGVAAFFDAQTVVQIVAVRARGNMRFEAAFYLARGIGRLLLVVVVCWLEATLINVLAATALANATGHLGVVLSSKGIKSVPIRLQGGYVLSVLRSATPFFFMSLIGALSLQSDVFMLGTLSSDYQVGLFSVALQIIQALTFLPTAAGIALQHELTKSHAKSRLVWQQQVVRAFALAAVSCVFASATLYYTAPFVISSVFSEKFRDASNTLQVLIVAFGFKSICAAMIVPAFVSAGRVHLWSILILASLTLHVAVNALLIPIYGAMGAAYSTLAADAAVTIAAILALRPSLSRAYAYPARP